MACKNCGKKKKPIKKLKAKSKITAKTQKLIEKDIKLAEEQKLAGKGTTPEITPSTLKSTEKDIDKSVFNPDKEAIDPNHQFEINYPSVDELREVDFYFNSKYKLNYDEVNKTYRQIFDEDIKPDGCRGCESRSHRKWIAFIGEMLIE